MRVKGYGAYPTRNVQTGGQRPSYYDEYNREYKKEKYKSAEEYACRNVKEYNRYPEYKDLTGDDDNRGEQLSVTGAVLQYGTAARAVNTLNKRRRIAQQVVCLIAGSTIIVSTYQAMTKQQPPEPVSPLPAIVQTDEDDPVEPEDIIPEEETTVPEEATTAAAAAVNYTTKWVWDGSKATLKLYDSSGNLVSEVPATVSVSTKDATCTQEGLKTYTATASYDGKSYSDTRTETLDALGHSFDDGKEVTQDNGKTAMVFECERCHEQFKIANSMSEND